MAGDTQHAGAPAPLTPAECDLQDFEFMPVMVRRLLKSETWSLGNGDERAAAVALWFESWHQVPAASLPSHDKLLARLADTTKWAKVKPQALRGWLLCSDGRLYHPVVAEKALEAWIEKLMNSISGAAGNAKRWGVTVDVADAKQQFMRAVAMLRILAPQSKTLRKKSVISLAAGSPPDSPPDRKGQGEGERQGSISAPNGAGGDAAEPDLIDACAGLEMRTGELTDTEETLLWNAALALLIPKYGTGSDKAKDAKARVFVGGLGKRLKDAGIERRALFEVIQAACVERPANPETWMSAAVASRTGTRKSNSRQAERKETMAALGGEFVTGASHAAAGDYIDV